MTNPALTKQLVFKLMNVYTFPIDRSWLQLTRDYQDAVEEARVDIGYYSANGADGFHKAMIAVVAHPDHK